MKKRSKMLALMMVLAFALTGVGYAWWTDTLYINGTVETGNLAVEFDEGCPGVLPLVGDAPYVTATAEYDETKKICTFEVSGLYPGASVLLDIQQKNKGSIPAKFDKATLTVVEDPGNIIDDLNCTAWYVGDKNGNAWGGGTGGFIQIDQPLASLGTNMTAAISGLVLEPGGWINFDNPEDTSEDPNCIILTMKKTADNATQNQTIKFQLQMDWKQFNQ